jgi:hypothetical protein
MLIEVDYMQKMQNINYKIRTLSSIVLSPRAGRAFFFDEKKVKTDAGKDVKIVYPFYQYGDYSEYAPEANRYYIPGSSLKGAICSELDSFDPIRKKLFVEDILLENRDIVLRNLLKGQYLGENKNTMLIRENEEAKTAILGIFFPEIGIEMLKADTKLSGSILIEGDFPHLLSKANVLSKRKISQMEKRIQNLYEEIKKARAEKNTPRDNNQEETLLSEKLNVILENLKKIHEENFILMLGGYKGLLHSIVCEKQLPDPPGALYIDESKMLPYGIVQVEL